MLLKHCNNNIIMLNMVGHSYLLKCKCCDRFQVLFNNILINFTKIELLDFKNLMEENLKMIETDNIYFGKDIIIKCNDYSNVSFTFSKKEVVKMIGLITEGLNINKAHDIIACSETK